MSNSNMDDVYILLLSAVSNALELGLHPTKGKDVTRTKELSRIIPFWHSVAILMSEEDGQPSYRPKQEVCLTPEMCEAQYKNALEYGLSHPQDFEWWVLEDLEKAGDL